jgi:hypothetical protein
MIRVLDAERLACGALGRVTSAYICATALPTRDIQYILHQAIPQPRSLEC